MRHCPSSRGGGYAAPRSSRASARGGADEGGGTIAGQYGDSPEQKQQTFGRVDPFCLFAVVPMLVVAGLFLWSGIASIGMVMIALTILVVVADAWANRPIRKSEPRYRDNR